MAAFLKHGNNSNPKNAAIHTKNAALDMGYSRTYKMRLHMNNLSCFFKKCGFIPSVAAFLKMWRKKTQPKAHVFCSVPWVLDLLGLHQMRSQVLRTRLS